MRIRVLDIVRETMVDGPGLRTAVYCAGCRHACPGCHNPQSWDFRAGRWMDVEEVLDVILSEELCDVTFTGGDPMYQAEALTDLARRVRAASAKTIWCWTGFLYEQVLADPVLSAFASELDVLVDGPFVASLRDVTLPFRGSSNQRVIRLRGTICKPFVIWESGRKNRMPSGWLSAISAGASAPWR